MRHRILRYTGLSDSWQHWQQQQQQQQQVSVPSPLVMPLIRPHVSTWQLWLTTTMAATFPIDYQYDHPHLQSIVDWLLHASTSPSSSSLSTKPTPKDNTNDDGDRPPSVVDWSALRPTAPCHGAVLHHVMKQETTSSTTAAQLGQDWLHTYQSKRSHHPTLYPALDPRQSYLVVLQAWCRRPSSSLEKDGAVAFLQWMKEQQQQDDNQVCWPPSVMRQAHALVLRTLLEQGDWQHKQQQQQQQQQQQHQNKKALNHKQSTLPPLPAHVWHVWKDYQDYQFEDTDMDNTHTTFPTTTTRTVAPNPSLYLTLMLECWKRNNANQVETLFQQFEQQQERYWRDTHEQPQQEQPPPQEQEPPEMDPRTTTEKDKDNTNNHKRTATSQFETKSGGYTMPWALYSLRLRAWAQAGNPQQAQWVQEQLMDMDRQGRLTTTTTMTTTPTPTHKNRTLPLHGSSFSSSSGESLSLDSPEFHHHHTKETDHHHESTSHAYHWSTAVLEAWKESNHPQAAKHVLHCLQNVQQRHQQRQEQQEKASQHESTDKGSILEYPAPDIHAWNLVLATLTKAVLKLHAKQERQPQQDLAMKTTKRSSKNPNHRANGKNPNHRDSSLKAQQNLLLQIQTCWKEMPRPNILSYNLLMTLWSKYGKPQELERVFQQLVEQSNQQQEQEPSSAHNNSLLKPRYNEHVQRLQAWAQAGHPERTKQALKDMIEGHAAGDLSRQPGSQEFSTVLQAWMRSDRPDAPHQAEQGLRRMQHLANQGRFPCHPNAYTYGAVISAWARYDIHNNDKAVTKGKSPMRSNKSSTDDASSTTDPGKEALRLLDELADLARQEPKSSPRHVELQPLLTSYIDVLGALVRSAEARARQRDKQEKRSRRLVRTQTVDDEAWNHQSLVDEDPEWHKSAMMRLIQQLQQRPPTSFVALSGSRINHTVRRQQHMERRKYLDGIFKVEHLILRYIRALPESSSSTTTKSSTSGTEPISNKSIKEALSQLKQMAMTRSREPDLATAPSLDDYNDDKIIHDDHEEDDEELFVWKLEDTPQEKDEPQRPRKFVSATAS